MITANQVRDAFERHRENHAMLLVLMRRVRRSMDDTQHSHFEGEFTEIAEAIVRHGHAVRALIETSVADGTLADQRSGQDRRRPIDRRWHIE